MATPVEVPKLGNSVEECIIGRWLKHAGDTVAAGDAVAEIETDKTTFEVTAPVAGTLLATFFDEGAVVPVFTNFFVIGKAGESAEAFRPGGAAAPAASPAAAPEPVAVAAAALAATPSVNGGARMSPRARRFAEVNDFHPASVIGSGPGGRILEEDLRKLYEAGPRSAPAPARAATPAPAPVPAAKSASKGSRLRETVARRMRESLSTTAQYTMNTSADAAGLMVMRARLKASAGSSFININHLVSFCAVRALLDVPALNAEFINGAIQEHAEIHLGFACDTPKGLMVPVVRNAHSLGLSGLASRMMELTARANQGSIGADDLTGATFTISNLGNLGIESFTPLLNPPQVAILGVNAIDLKAVRREGRVEFIDAIGFSLTCDHQAIDGAPGARFLQVLKKKIEGVEAECQNRF
jgi:pyruvate dehydrogenase E2 component (dihydrolipoamide acetyltransferase)